MGLVDYFLKLDGIEGESQDATHSREIEIENWSFGQTQSGTSAYGSGAGAGRVSMQDFRFVKRIDKSSPKLMQLCANGQHIREAILTARKAGGTQLEYMKVKFKDLIVSSYQTAGSASSDIIPRDEISLNFSAMILQYKEQKPDGSLGGAISAGWDAKRNQEVSETI